MKYIYLVLLLSVSALNARDLSVNNNSMQTVIALFYYGNNGPYDVEQTLVTVPPQSTRTVTVINSSFWGITCILLDSSGNIATPYTQTQKTVGDLAGTFDPDGNSWGMNVTMDLGYDAGAGTLYNDAQYTTAAIVSWEQAMSVFALGFGVVVAPLSLTLAIKAVRKGLNVGMAP